MPYKDPKKRRAYHQAYHKKYYPEHKQDYYERKKRWRKENPEKYRAQQMRERPAKRKHYQENKQYYKDKNTRWRLANPERNKEIQRKSNKKAYDRRKREGECTRCGRDLTEAKELHPSKEVPTCPACHTRSAIWVKRNKFGDFIPRPVNPKKQ